MLRNTTLTLPHDLIARANAYAASHGTTVTAIVRDHLATVIAEGLPEVGEDPLLAFSQGRLARSDAIRLIGLRDYAGLLVALGDADLPLPLPPADVIEDQAAAFAELWRQG